MRAFIAVDAPSAALSRLQQEIMSTAGWKARDVKPVEAQNFHFTMIFLGEIDEHQAETVKEMLSGVTFEPFSITYRGVGAFPKPDFARVIWVGVDPAGGQKLVALADKIASLMAQIGFKQDKPFSPHLTLFRVKNNTVRLGSIADKYKDVDFGSDLIDKVHLKKSDLSPSGPTYSNIYTVRAVTDGQN